MTKLTETSPSTAPADPRIITAPEEFLRDFHYLKTIGATPNGGVNREAATVPDAMQRAWFGGWLASHGFRIHVDEIGNQFGLLEMVPGAPYIIAGSHLDSQPTAGAYDGAYGVIAAAHAAATVARQAAAGDLSPRFNVGVVNWFNEEGSRFAPSMMGSSVFTGKLALEDAHAVTDKDGVSVKEALSAIGHLGTPLAEEIAGYLEIHVEQGKELEREGVPIGIVTGTWGARKFQVTVTGAQAHTGSALMEDRRDALLGAAALIVAVRELAEENSEHKLHTAVSQIETYPNSPVTVTSHTRCNMDLRCESAEVLEAAEAAIRKSAIEISERWNIDIEIERTHQWDVNPYTDKLLSIPAAVSDELGYGTLNVNTVAGHDSTNMKDIVPTIMLFVPSTDGLSHNEGEFTPDTDLVAGVKVLTGSFSKLVEGNNS